MFSSFLPGKKDAFAVRIDAEAGDLIGMGTIISTLPGLGSSLKGF